MKYKGGEVESSASAHPSTSDPDYAQAWQTYNQYWSQMAAYTASTHYYDATAAAYYA